MMDKFHVKGFPNEISRHIELPDIAELLLMPLFGLASTDDVRKYGTDIQKEILDNCPIRPDSKYVSVTSQVQLLYPEVRSVPNSHVANEDEWHRDGSMSLLHTPDRMHLLLSKCQSLTEFNCKEMYLDADLTDYSKLCKYINSVDVGFVPAKIPHNKVVTFDSHIHRTTRCNSPEFRFMFRVAESDHRAPLPIDRSLSTHALVSRRIGEARNTIDNIHREANRITIYYKNL